MVGAAALVEEADGAPLGARPAHLRQAGGVSIDGPGRGPALIGDGAAQPLDVLLVEQLVLGRQLAGGSTAASLVARGGQAALEVSDQAFGPSSLSGGARGAQLGALLAVSEEPLEASQSEAESPHGYVLVTVAASPWTSCRLAASKAASSSTGWRRKLSMASTVTTA